MMAKVRADREAARLKREAAEKQQEKERSAMQCNDKLCYQEPPSSGAAKSRRSASRSRPVSALRSAGGKYSTIAHAISDMAILRNMLCLPQLSVSHPQALTGR